MLITQTTPLNELKRVGVEWIGAIGVRPISGVSLVNVAGSSYRDLIWPQSKISRFAPASSPTDLIASSLPFRRR